MSVYKQLVWELGSRDTHGVLLLGCTPDVARFVLPEGPLVLVVAHRAGEPARTREVAVTALAQHGNPAGAEIGAAGDPGGLAALGTIGRARLHGVDESGTVTSTHPKAVPKTLAACLREVARNPGQLRLGPDELNAWLAERAAAAQATIGKIEAYQKALGARTPRAVPALIAVTMAVYLLQVLWGGC